jgi:antitoxin CcdA
MRIMSKIVALPSRKRAVNLTLNDELVRQARGMTDNLSAVVETLLTDFVRQQGQARQAHRLQASQAAHAWNDFNAASGSFADEYSTL